MPDKAQPGRTICSCFVSIVFREHAADDVFVDIDAKGTRNLLCDAGTANTGIAAWNLNKVLGFRMTASLGIRLAGTTQDPKPSDRTNSGSAPAAARGC